MNFVRDFNAFDYGEWRKIKIVLHLTITRGDLLEEKNCQKS